MNEMDKEAMDDIEEEEEEKTTELMNRILAGVTQSAYDAGFLAALRSVRSVLQSTDGESTLRTLDLMIEQFMRKDNE